MSKEMKKKFTKTFDLSQIAEDPMDSYLDTLGLWKKRIARDGSCLFRAVAEQIYPCQLHHERVRQECIRYMSDHKDDFSKFLTNITFEEYLEAMKNPLEYAGQLEIAAMSKLYNRDFIIYQHPDQPGIDVTQNAYEKKIYLCYSYNNHFDAIFTKTHRDCLALIQSFVYEILYDKVFGSGEQVAVARRLLRKSDTIYPKEYMRGEIDYDDDDDDSDLGNELEDEGSSDSIENIDFEEDSHHSILMTDSVNESNMIKNSGEKSLTEITEKTETSSESTIDQNNNEIKSSPEKPKLNATSTISTTTITTTTQINTYNSSYSDKSIIQKMPLPYKVAKSLDPVIYRNTAFDAWQAAKKEHEEALNQKAISILQTGDKCLVKLNNNYSEKWNLAYVQNIQQDIANVFVVELNENHCVGLENLKPYKNSNEMPLLHHQNGFGYQTIPPVNNIQNVHKLVQSVNAQFSKIFVNIDNKRRNVKKKQFNSMKKSSSFHAFSTELPTLIEVEEQLVEQDPFHYGHHYYLNNPHNQPMYHAQPHHHHHHQQHSLPHHSMGYHASQPNNNHMNNQFGYINSTNNASFSSLPHSQVFNEFNDSNKPKLANSMSASNLNQFNSMQNNMPGQLNPGVNNSNNNASNLNNRNNRRQRYPQNANINFSFNTPFNNSMKQPWNNNFVPGPMGPHTAGFLPPPPLLHHQIPGGQHLPNQPFNAGMGPMGPQQLGPNQGFMQPPPSMAQMHGPNGPMPNVPFIHQGPPPQMPMPPLNHPQNGQSTGPGHRPNFFNPISSFMFGPPPATHSTNQTQPTHLNHNQSHSLEHTANNYYFPSANTNASQSQNNTQHNSNKSQMNNNNRNRNEKTNTSSENFNNTSNNNSNNNNNSNSKQMIQGQANNTGYQQVPQHLQSSQVNSAPAVSTNTGLINMPPPTTTASSTNTNDKPHTVLPNTSNYLLMPVPQANNNTSSATSNSSSNNLQQQHGSGPSSTTIVPPVQSSNYNPCSNGSMTKSHSYHSGVSAQSYDTSNSNSSTVNPHNNLLVQANNMNNTNNNSSLIGNTHYSGNGTNVGLDNPNYGTNTFQNYEVQYPRFENNSFPVNQNLLDENLTNTANEPRHNNLWNKGNKLTKNNSLFNDMVYTENPTGNNSSNLLTNNTQNSNQYYTNCFVVNIDGPINFNATHSLLDDGSDLPMTDVNTIRFFYNLGIEYYRLNLATPYNQGQNYYPPSSVGPVAGTNQIPTNTNIPSSQNTAVVTGSSGTSTKLKDEVSSNVSNSSNTANNTLNGHVNQQQVVPQANLNKPLIQHSYTSRRVVH